MEEKEGMTHFYGLFLEEVNHKGTEALSLATLISELMPEIPLAKRMVDLPAMIVFMCNLL